MIKVNGKTVEQNRFPDGTLTLSKITTHEDNVIRWCYESDSEMFTLMCIVDILRRNGSKWICLELPYLPNARMDRIKSLTENFSLKVFCNWLNSLNLDRVEVFNVHSTVSEALINNVIVIQPGFDILEVCSKYRPDVIFFPDEGACKRYSDLDVIKELNLPIAFGIKKRDWKTGNILGLEVVNGDVVEGKKVLIIDDICSAGGTFKFSAIKLKDLGAEDVALYISHCEDNIVNGDLLKTSLVSKIYTTDSICKVKNKKIEILSRFF